MNDEMRIAIYCNVAQDWFEKIDWNSGEEHDNMEFIWSKDFKQLIIKKRYRNIDVTIKIEES